MIFDVGGEEGPVAPPQDHLLAAVRCLPIHFHVQLVGLDQPGRLGETFAHLRQEEDEPVGAGSVALSSPESACDGGALRSPRGGPGPAPRASPSPAPPAATHERPAAPDRPEIPPHVSPLHLSPPRGRWPEYSGPPETSKLALSRGRRLRRLSLPGRRREVGPDGRPGASRVGGDRAGDRGPAAPDTTRDLHRRPVAHHRAAARSAG